MRIYVTMREVKTLRLSFHIAENYSVHGVYIQAADSCELLKNVIEGLIIKVGLSDVVWWLCLFTTFWTFIVK